MPTMAWGANTRGVFVDSDAATGYIYGYDAGSYATARNKTEGNVKGDDIGITGQLNDYTIDRTYITIDTSALTSYAVIDSAKFKCVLGTNQQSSGFDICLIGGSFTGAAVVVGWFNDFVGWQVSGAYNPTQLATAIGSATVTAGDTLTYSLNAAGLAAISKTSSTRLILISSADIASSQPTSTDRTYIEDDSMYLEVWYNIMYPATNTRAILRKDGTTTPYRTDGGITPLK
jgi:hypothetical protein